MPYHSVETLIVEAPDHGHETTSEAFSYWLWLEAELRPGHRRLGAVQRRVGRRWRSTSSRTHADQPTNASYNPAKPATYAPEHPLPSQYPARSTQTVAVGTDPIAAELKSAYGTADIYGMHWLLDVDNVYGYGTPPARRRERPARPARPTSTPSSAARRSRSGRPCRSRHCDTFKYGGKNGYLDLFTGDASYAKQWKYTNAPDADARAVQAAYWALKWATDAGQGVRGLRLGGQGRQDGRLPALLDVRQVLQADRQLHQPDRLRGRHRQERGRTT